MSQGRERGYAGIIATQPLSKLHEHAAAEANNVIIGRTWLEADQARAGGALGLSKTDRLKLRDLDQGEFSLLSAGSALIDYWCGRLRKAERLILETLTQVYPDPLTKEESWCQSRLRSERRRFQQRPGPAENTGAGSSARRDQSQRQSIRCR